MRHVPHVYVPAPWTGSTIAMGDAGMHHLRRVLRLANGDAVSYTDGAGTVGRGTLAADGITRGSEATDGSARATLTVAVAAPKAPDRQRFIVEKLAEVGVDQLVWLKTARGEGRSPKPEKCRAWNIAALEQSRRSRLMAISGPAEPIDVAPEAERLVADVAGGRGEGMRVTGDLAIFVGPEGGFSPDELPEAWPRVALSDGVLRVETAAVVAGVVGRRMLTPD